MTELNQEVETKPAGNETEKVVRFQSAWNLFMRENKAQFLADYPDCPIKELSKIASEKYKKLPPEEKAKYEAKSLEIKNEIMKNTQNGGLSHSKSDSFKKNKKSPYFVFMTARHDELRVSNPEMNYTERTNQIREEWSKKTMIEKAHYENQGIPLSKDQSPSQANQEIEPETEELEEKVIEESTVRSEDKASNESDEDSTENSNDIQ